MPLPLPLLFLTALLAIEPAPEGDTVCGPRCVQAILRSYGQEAELIDLVRELHTEGVEKGTTLGQMRDAFEQRGLHAAVVHLPRDATLTWPEPVIVHLKPLGKQTMGHFIVATASNDETISVHDLLNGTLRGTQEELRKTMSGDILLVSKLPISATAEFGRQLTPMWKPYVYAACALGVSVGLWRNLKTSVRSR